MRDRQCLVSFLAPTPSGMLNGSEEYKKKKGKMEVEGSGLALYQGNQGHRLSNTYISLTNTYLSFKCITIIYHYYLKMANCSHHLVIINMLALCPCLDNLMFTTVSPSLTELLENLDI